MTAGRPGRKIPAFSRPIDSRSGPSQRTWSMSMGVTTATSGSNALTASSRPPMPTSITAASTADARKTSTAARVPNSK